MGMIMNKSGKFKDRHPKAYKILRVLTILLFCLSFFFVGLFIGLTFQVAGDYKEGFNHGRNSHLYNASDIIPPLSPAFPDDLGVPNNGFLSIAPSNDLIGVTSYPNFSSMSNDDYLYLIFASSYMSSIPTEIVSPNQYTYSYCMQMTVDVPYAQKGTPLWQSLLYQGFLPSNFYEISMKNPKRNNYSFTYSTSLFASEYCAIPYISFSKGDILSAIPSLTVSDSLYSLLSYLSTEEYWSAFLNSFRFQAISPLREDLSLSLSPSGSSLPSFAESLNAGGEYIPAYVIFLSPKDSESGSVLSGFNNSYNNFVMQYLPAFFNSWYDNVYNVGFSAGKSAGYDLGYSDGYNVGISNSGGSLNINWLLSFSNSFLSMPIFGGITLGNFLMVGIMLASFGGLLKLFFGG